MKIKSSVVGMLYVYMFFVLMFMFVSLELVSKRWIQRQPAPAGNSRHLPALADISRHLPAPASINQERSINQLASNRKKRKMKMKDGKIDGQGALE